MLFLHNSYGTPEFPVCGNLVGEDWMENLRWGDTDPSMHFRETNTDPSMHFSKANMDLAMHFRKANMKFLFPVYFQLWVKWVKSWGHAEKVMFSSHFGLACSMPAAYLQRAQGN